MAKIFYKRAGPVSEQVTVCPQLNPEDLVFGRIVVFDTGDKEKSPRSPAKITLDIPRPSFLTVVSVFDDFIVFADGTLGLTHSVFKAAISENNLNGEFFDLAGWWKWQEAFFQNRNDGLEREVGQLRRDKGLLTEILSANMRVITEQEAKKLGIA